MVGRRFLEYPRERILAQTVKKALAILTYARPCYLELVLPSILQQQIFGRPVDKIYDIHLFQDGLWREETEENIRGHKCTTRIVESLAARYPVTIQPSNLGVAFHFDFVERLLFLEKSYDFVAFFEDDLLLAPGYMQALDLMADKFRDDPRVGMVSAHPGNPTIPLETQRLNLGRFERMGHNWGFGLSRTFWERRQPFVDCYLDLVRGKPYRQRPHNLVYEWLRASGFPGAASSQDYIKQCATYALGACRLSTGVNYALPIGRSGLHCKPHLFKKMGFDRTEVYDQEIAELGELDDRQFQSLYAKQGHQVGERFVVNQTIDTPKWEQRLRAGEFHPSRLLGQPKTGVLTQTHDQGKKTDNSNNGSGLPSGHAAAGNIKDSKMDIMQQRTNSPVMSRLYPNNVWEGFSPAHPAQEVQGWNSNHPALTRCIRGLRPQVIIDVGVWKGLSTINLARALKDSGTEGCVIAVDTFLGSPEHWDHSRNLFRRIHGYPDLYQQFLSNVYHAGLQDYVVPMPQTSHVAAALLKKYGIKASLIHIDAAHEYEDVFRDARAYWEILEDGGVLVGDDYHPTWPGVVRAADEFAGSVGRQLSVESPKWIISK
jgi:predicted O-methyltransferase YrrM